MEQSDNTVRSGDDQFAIASSRYPTSTLLLGAIHRGEVGAIRELFILYAPLLRDQARRMSVNPDERDEVVTTLLDDVVLHLMENEITPRHLARYLVAALRNRARNRHRNAKRQRTTRDGAYSELGHTRERIVAECHSEYGVHAAQPADAEATLPLRLAIAKLAEKSATELNRDEMIMMIGIGRHVPLRDIAEQLGITYGAARVRLHRLRDRFGRLAIQYVATLKADERREIERFFRRAQVGISEKKESESEQRVNGPLQQRSPREKTNDQN